MTVAASPPAKSTGRRRGPIARRVLVDVWIDVVLLVSFTFDYSFRFTGLTIHEWIGFVFVVAIPIHLVQHWSWIVRTTRRLAHRRRGREALRWLVDLLLMPTMTLCVASGLLVSQRALPALGLHPGDDDFWRGLHTTSADVTLALAALHVALSWRWGWTILNRLTGRPWAR